MATALQIVKRMFPQVKVIKDAERNSTIEVTKRDESTSQKKNHSGCALAVACKRSKKLDGAVVSVTMAYLVKGQTATRYQLRDSASREVVSFDRGGGFEPGEYELVKPDQKLGTRPGRKGTHDARTGKKQHYHRTTNIREPLAEKDK